MKTTFVLTLLLAFTGLSVLWVIFFKKPKDKDTINNNENPGKRKEYKRIQSLIRNMEEENPELIKDLATQLNAAAKLKSIKESHPDDINLVLKYWLYDDW
ncbi:MAG: hypothetical protein A4E52_01099 [Pelotomaculum sp. PtaB.Bin013]|uniref:Uncharacterized protein n=1 Tax=Pelotomaculum isophthalicicum JI TaxID=947010 RepID=A0A9X4H4T7_9FIRM|nr:hypothetical protein [Pelotomaculum isophthalicicum]MDF9407034.1 hypothetical protein [Pelotomaculum isophthalicicum JI]OPX89153.1 MAG: hypothetical protein A4E52_01099 [Pelotomaculum sp. PtaB.Bin013]